MLEDMWQLNGVPQVWKMHGPSGATNRQHSAIQKIAPRNSAMHPQLTVS